MRREFSQAELKALAYRAGAEALRLSVTSPRLARAFERLSGAADAAHAIDLRENGPERRQAAPEDEDDAEDTEEPTEVPESQEVPLIADPGFAVRPRGSQRICSVPGCGKKQWRSPSGWVCDNGHGGAPPLEE